MIEDQTFYWTLLDTLKDGVYFADRDRKVTYWNKAAERITGYKAGEILGKHCADNILVHIDEQGNNLCTGVCPLAQCMETKDPFEKRIFLHHKDGHRMPVLVQVTPVYGAKDEVVGAVEIFTDLSSKEPFLKDLEERDQQDRLSPITGLPDKQFLVTGLALKVFEWNEFERPFGVFTITVDGLEDVKKTRGEETYSGILKTLARTLLHNINPADVLGEWSANVFLGIVPGGDADKLAKKAEGYRILLEKSMLPNGGAPVSITFTVKSTTAKTGDTIDSILERL